MVRAADEAEARVRVFILVKSETEVGVEVCVLARGKAGVEVGIYVLVEVWMEPLFFFMGIRALGWVLVNSFSQNRGFCQELQQVDGPAIDCPEFIINRLLFLIELANPLSFELLQLYLAFLYYTPSLSWLEDVQHKLKKSRDTSRIDPNQCNYIDWAELYKVICKTRGRSDEKKDDLLLINIGVNW